MIKCFAFE